MTYANIRRRAVWWCRDHKGGYHHREDEHFHCSLRWFCGPTTFATWIDA